MPITRPRPERGRAAQPRLRVLAGPNGSGKSTIKRELRPEWIGVFVNADEIEHGLREGAGSLELSALGITGPPVEILARLRALILNSSLAERSGLHARLDAMSIDDRWVLQVPGAPDSYLASVLADAVRRELLRQGRTFTFETVMSHADKIEFMKEARAAGYRVYLYFVATDDPEINVDRVRRRVELGGHPVPRDKVLERYVRSIGLMTQACDVADRAYVFDNSGSEHKLLVQVDAGDEMTIATSALPRWFIETELWRQFSLEAGQPAKRQ